MSGLMRLDPIRPRRWPWVVLAVFAAAAAAAFYALPRYGDAALAMLQNALPARLLPEQVAQHAQATPGDILAKAHLLDMRAQFDRQMTALASHGAEVWGGAEFNDARMRAAEARGADEAGNPVFAATRLAEAQVLLDAVEKRAPPPQPAPQPAATERAPAAGRMQSAKQGFEVAQRTDPTNRTAAEGPQHMRSLDAAAPLEKARADRSSGSEAISAAAPAQEAQRAHGYDSARQRAVSLEAQERWDEALNEYESVLKADPSAAFAQQGKLRSASRAFLAQRLQELIDRPEQLASAAARADALALIENADAQSPSGPVLRSQVARLQILLPAFDKPVHLALMSDGATRVAIPSIGFSGVFSQHEIQLKPGKYTVVGTRDGYRDVRRDITIAPGQDVQTISVSCGEPI